MYWGMGFGGMVSRGLGEGFWQGDLWSIYLGGCDGRGLFVMCVCVMGVDVVG